MIDFKKIINYKLFISICIIFSVIMFFLIILMLLKPNVIILGNKLEQVEIYTKYKDKGIIATIFGKDITSEVQIYNNVNANKLGTYKVIYNVPYLKKVPFAKFNTYNRIVNIVDNIKPEIKLNGDVNYKQSYKTTFIEPGFSAIDNCDGDITSKVITSKETINDTCFKIIYKVTDSSKNEQILERIVNIVDDIKPELKLVGSNIVNIQLGVNYAEQGATAYDDKDGNLTSKIIITGKVNTQKEGQYILTYTVTDNSLNTATITRIVNITIPGNNISGTIYLTFDDGPSANITPHILDILKQKNVKATFFVLNYGTVNEYLIKRIVNEGHTIAIHGYSHVYREIYTSVDVFMNNFISLQNKIKNSTGVTTTILRFPGGSSNTVSRFNPGIMTKLTNEVLNKGFHYFDWNITSGDAGEVKTKEAVYKNVIRGLSKDKENVVLMHDFSGNYKTLYALENIIDYGNNNGYIFDKITESTPMVHHKVVN
ncbi:MAG: polysaccharide deacetylase family protein [Clostridia bacterium]